MKIEQCLSLIQPTTENKKTSIRSISFHPTQRKICVGYRHDIFEYDLVTGAQLLHFTTPSEVTHLEHGITDNVLVAALRNGIIMVWELSNGTLSSFHYPGKKQNLERCPPICFVISHLNPVIYYSRIKSNNVQVLGLFSDGGKNKIEYYHKKPVSSLNVHPTKELLAVGLTDGTVKIWSTDNQHLKYTLDCNDIAEVKKGLFRRIEYSSPITCVLFHPKKDIFFTANQNGRIICWNITKTPKIVGVIELDTWITTIKFHPNLHCLICLSEKGIVKFLSLSQLHKETRINILEYDKIDTFYIPVKQEKYSTEHLLPMVHFKIDQQTGQICFYGKRLISTKEEIPLYKIIDELNPESQFPLVDNFHLPLDIFVEEGSYVEYKFPILELFYFENLYPNLVLKSYNIKTNESSNHQILMCPDNFRCLRYVMNKSKTMTIVFYESVNQKIPYTCSRIIIGKEDDENSEGIDGCFLGDTDDYLILANKHNLKKGKEIVPLDEPIGRIFSSNYDENLILYYNTFLEAIGFANPKTFQFDSSKLFFLLKNEKIMNIYWHKEMICILTTCRVVILSLDLLILAEANGPILSFHSCIWVGNVILYNTSLGVFTLAPNSRPYPVCSLDNPHSILCGVLADRLIFSWKTNNVVQISYRYIRLVEPLLLSIIKDSNSEIEIKKKQLKMITTRFDCRYISEKTLFLLEQNGFSFLASELLLESQYSFPWYLRFRLALSSLNFSYALTIITNQCKEDYEIVPESSEYFSYLIELAKQSLDYGQFDVASTCFDMMEDVWSLFKIFSFDQNLNALSFLANKCKNNSELYSIYEACNIILQGELFEESKQVQNWSLKISDGSEDFELGREIIGRMTCNDKAIELLDLDDLSTWMGFTSEIKEQEALTVEEKTFDYNKEFGGERRKSIALLAVEGIEDVTLPTPRSRSEKTSSEQKTAGHESEIESELDQSQNKNNEEEDAISAQEAARKQFLESSDDDDDDDDDEDAIRRRKKRMLFKSIRISQAPIRDETKIASQSSNSLKLGLEDPDEQEEEQKPKPRFGSLNLEDDDEEEEKPKPKPKPKFGGLKQLKLDDSDDSEEENEKKIVVQKPKNPLVQSTPLPDVPFVEKKKRSFGELPNASNIETSDRKLPNVPRINLSQAQQQQQKLAETPQTPQQPQHQQIVNPGEALKKGMEFMEKGQYIDAIKQVNSAIQALIVDKNQILKKNNIILCIRYKFLIFALAKLQKLELSKGDPKEAALISTCMTQLVIPNPKHNIITKNMAIKRNMAVKNYGISARIMKELRKIAPPNLKEVLIASYKECESHQFSDSNSFKEGSKFCWKTFKIIDPPTNGLQCSYCEATYDPIGNPVKVDQSCYYCSYGKLQKIEF
eukprot:gene6049-10050_t